MIPERPSWHAEAACRGLAELFYGPPRETAEARAEREAVAVAVCSICPVQEPCARQGRREHNGVWAGEVRDDASRAVGGQPTPIPHGTEAGYVRHRREGSIPCWDCKDAHARAQEGGDLESGRTNHHARAVAS